MSKIKNWFPLVLILFYLIIGNYSIANEEDSNAQYLESTLSASSYSQPKPATIDSQFEIPEAADSLGVIFGFGVYFGFTLILLIYGVLVYVNVRQLVFLWFSLFVLFLTIHVTLISGLLFSPYNPLVAQFGMANAFLIQLSFTRFFQLVIDIKNQFIKRYQLLNYMVYLSLIFTIGYFIFSYSQVFISLTRIILLLSIGIVFWSMIRNDFLSTTQTKLLVGALLFLIAAGVLLAINQWTSFYPKEQLFRWGIVLISLHVLWISVSILYRVKKLNDSRESLWLDIRKTKKGLLEAYLKGVEEEKIRVVAELENNVLVDIESLKIAVKELPNSKEETKMELNRIKNSVTNITSELSGKQNISSRFIKQVADFVDSHESEKLLFILDFFNFSGGLQPIVEEQLYRIIQEAVQNIEKYANATQVNIQFIQNEAELILSIEDNGIGFDEKKKSDGIGILNMRKRAYNMGGTLNINTSQGNGTSIFVAIGLNE